MVPRGRVRALHGRLRLRVRAARVRGLQVCPLVRVKFTPDQYPQETSWDLKRVRDGAVLASVARGGCVLRSPRRACTLAGGVCWHL